MKKQILMMALCVSTLMPVTVFGEEAAVQNVSTVNKEETASGDGLPGEKRGKHYRRSPGRG